MTRMERKKELKLKRSLLESGNMKIQVFELVVRNYYGEFDPGSG